MLFCHSHASPLFPLEIGQTQDLRVSLPFPLFFPLTFVVIISSKRSFLLRNTNIGVFSKIGFPATSLNKLSDSCIRFTELSSNKTCTPTRRHVIRLCSVCNDGEPCFREIESLGHDWAWEAVNKLINLVQFRNNPSDLTRGPIRSL